MSGLMFRVTHCNDSDVCKWCGCNNEEKSHYVCSGEPPAEGTFTKAILDEVKERQMKVYCVCGGSSLRESRHAHYCPSYKE